jgi:hypothetical protein
MENPFESGHIKNYILAYASVVVIMILFFIASTLFNDIEEMEKKVFDTNSSKVVEAEKFRKNIVEVNASRFKLLEKAY